MSVAAQPAAEFDRSNAKAAPVHLVPSAILSSFGEIAHSLGVDPHRLLRGAGLDPVCLVRPEMQLPCVKVTGVIEEAARVATVHDFGLRLALARGVPDIGPVSLLLREEPDLRSALRSLQSYIHLHSRSIKIVLDENAELPTVKGYLVLNASVRLAPQTSEMIHCAIFQMLRWLIGEAWSPVAVCFSHPAPPDISMHQRIFGCSVEFGHAIDGILLDPSDLLRPVSRNPAPLRRHAENYVRMLETGALASLDQSVADLIAVLLPSGRCSAASVARHLNMDRTTLNRRLASSGKSYSAILQAVRRDLAEKFGSGNWPFVEIADQLGFSSVSVFSRWFSLEYGESPRVWRKRRRLAEELA